MLVVVALMPPNTSCCQGLFQSRVVCMTCFVQASISVAVIFMSYVWHVNARPFLRMQTVLSTTSSGQSTAVAVIEGGKSQVTSSPLALQRLVRQKEEEAKAMQAAVPRQVSRKLTRAAEVRDAFPTRRQSRRRSSVAVLQEKARLAVVSIDYNSFESAFLVSSVRILDALGFLRYAARKFGDPDTLVFLALCRASHERVVNRTLSCVRAQVLILMAGMVFLSKGFSPGSVGASLLTLLVAAIVVFATVAFVAFVGFEVFRSIKYAKLHEHTRRAEADRVERTMINATHRNRWLRAAAVAAATAASTPAEGAAGEASPESSTSTKSVPNPLLSVLVTDLLMARQTKQSTPAPGVSRAIVVEKGGAPKDGRGGTAPG